MYQPPLFATADVERIAAHVAAHPLALIVSQSASGTPTADSLPLLLDRTRGQGVLLGHMARGNPLGQRFAPETLVVFPGPHAYVPSVWYAHPEEHVPTWNYAVVHAFTRPRVLPQEETLGVVRRQVAHFQPEGHPLPLDPPAELVEQLVAGIVAFELEVLRWEAKLKLSQNRSAEDRDRVRAQLRVRGRGDDLAVADLMDALVKG